jgi:hypothetical protein
VEVSPSHTDGAILTYKQCGYLRQNLGGDQCTGTTSKLVRSHLTPVDCYKHLHSTSYPQSDQCGRRKHVPRWPVSIFDLNSSLVNTKVQAAGTSLQYQAAASCSSADMLAITTLQPLTAKALILPRWYCASNYPRKFAAGGSTTRSKHASNLETQPIRRASLPWFYPSAVHPHPPT